jgi:uncharacterized protein
MLMSFGAKNFFCFKEAVEVSLMYGSQCPASVSGSDIATPVLCVKGANAAGKTNLIKIIHFIKYLAVGSFKALQPGEAIAVVPFFNSKEITELFVEFSQNDNVYRYEIGLTNKEIKFERLTRKKTKATVVFERNNLEFEAKSNFKELKSLKKVRENATLLSQALHNDLSSVMEVVPFFAAIDGNVVFTGRLDDDQRVEETSLFYQKNPAVFEKVKKLICIFDTGVTDIDLLEGSDKEGNVFYTPSFIHDHSSGSHHVPYYFESRGTRSLYQQLTKFVLSLEQGGVLAVDEFDVMLHPDIIAELVSLFSEKTTNPKGAQLIFSTHNSDIMDRLGKYRVYLVAKQDNESFAYRLDELKNIRNDRLLTPLYRDKKLGGVPNVKK